MKLWRRRRQLWELMLSSYHCHTRHLSDHVTNARAGCCARVWWPRMYGHRGVAASQYTIQGLWRRVTSSSSRDGHNSATWTPVLGTTRRPRARDTLILFYKHCCPMGPLLQTLTTPRDLSDQSVELSVPRRPRGSVGREMEVRKCPVFICIQHWSRWSPVTLPVTRHTFCARPQLAGHRSSS